ncbi:hypothetical protein Tco_0186835, partial [Tanacetum coccineum]
KCKWLKAMVEISLDSMLGRMLGIRMGIMQYRLLGIRNGNVVGARTEGNAIGNNADLDDIEEVNANCILMANLQQASTSGTQTDKAPVYDSDGSAEVHNYDDCYVNYNNSNFHTFLHQ